MYKEEIHCEAEIYRREAQNSKEKARNRTEGKAHKVLQKGKNKNESETKRKTEKQLREGSAEKKGAKNQVVDREQYKNGAVAMDEQVGLCKQ